MVALIMLFIGWQTSNNLWLYLALGLSVFSSLLTATKKVAVQKSSLDRQIEAALQKAVRAQNN